MADTDSTDTRRETYKWEGRVDVCPDYGTPEHYALGGGQGPIYEPLRWLEPRKDTAKRGLINERLP